MKKIAFRDINGKLTEPIEVKGVLFRPSVYGVIVQGSKVLLVPQWDGYDFPGGGMEVGETIDEALEREVKEETGLSVKRDKIIACESSFFLHPYDGKHYNSILAYYSCKDIQGEISDQGFDKAEKEYARKAEWIDADKVESLKFYNPVDSVSLIKKALSL